MTVAEKNQLPTMVDPLKMTNREVEMAGSVPMAAMKRLAEMVEEAEGEVAVSLHFGRDKAGQRFITGCINGQLQLLCQRCGQTIKHQFSIVPRMSPVLSEQQAKHLPEGYDPLIVQDEPISLAKIIEDEIILDLPMVPMHQEQKCSVAMPHTLAS